MKINIFNTLLAASVFLFSCDPNDPIEELSTTGEFVPNVYFAPINPVGFVNSTIESEVEYWSHGDAFNSIELLQTVYLLDNVKLDLKDVPYSYRYEGRRDKIEEEVYVSMAHKFTSFVPAKNAYIVRQEYEVPGDYKKITYAKNNTTLSGLNTALNEEIKEDFYNGIASALSKAQLHVILVEVNSAVSEDVFESYFQDGSLTESGLSSVKDNLKNIGIPSLIKDNFSYEVSHRVALFFTVENKMGVKGESVTRAFNVN